MTKTHLLIGVTGHRDLTNKSEQSARAEVHEFLGRLQASVSNTPIKLISGLADGADRLVAKVALDLGISVQAVLPMPQSMYENDFTAESLKDFKSLLNNDDVELVELGIPKHIDSSVAERQGKERNQLYAQLGEYLIQRSGILIALWDGKNNDAVGGTSDVVLRYLNAGGAGLSSDIDIQFLDKTSAHPEGQEFVFSVPVERTHAANKSEPPIPSKPEFLSGNFGDNTLLSQADIPSELELQLSHIDDYNSQYKKIVESGRFFTWGGMLDKLPNPESHPEYATLKAIDDEYQKADGLALYNQQFSDRNFKLFGYMSALMGLFFLLYAKILAAKLFLIGYLVLFLAGLWMFRQTDKHQWFSKHLMQRIIAETLRTRFYLILAGVDKKVNVGNMLDLTGVKQFSGFSWINQIFRSHQSIETDIKPPELQNSDIDFVCKEWLDDQKTYFNKKIDSLSHRHHKLEKIKGRLLIASAVAVAVLIFFKKDLVGVTLIGSLDMKTLLVFFMGLLPFWLGVWEIYQSKMAIKELLWQYRNQSNLFNLASIQVAHCKTIEQKRAVLTELGQKSLMENFLWTIHRHHREHEPPTAG